YITVLFIFFFFQAEDGIRDFHVTGVQTCALPIFPVADRAWPDRDRQLGRQLAVVLQLLQGGHRPPRRGVGSVLVATRAGKPGGQIGRASCREREESSVVDGSCNKRVWRIAV